jgi:spore maturation protein CgeB
MQNALQLFTAQNGMMSARIVLPDTTTRHIHSVVDPSIESKFFKKFEFWGDLIVFTGIGLGYHITKKIKEIPSSSSLIVIDYFDELIALAKTGLFAGLPNSITFISASSALNLPPVVVSKRVQIIKHPASFAIHSGFYESVLAKIHGETRALPMADKKPRQSAMLLFGNHFLEEEIRSALCARNIEPVLFRYNNFSFGMEFENAFSRCIQENRPSFIMSINMKGFDGNGALAEITERFNIPVIIWFVDDPRPIVLHKRTFIKSSMIALTWEKVYIDFLETLGFNKVFFLPLASDPTLFSRSTLAMPVVPIGFVGSSMIDDCAGNIREKFLWNDSLERLTDHASEKLITDPFFAVLENLPVLAKSLDVPMPFSDEVNLTWLCAYCLHKASMKKRKRIITGLLDQGIETFGDPGGWKRLIGANIKTNPNVDYRNALCDTYRKICVNVNSTSSQMPSAVNQRVFDIPLCGSFVISDKQKDLGEFFDMHKEIVTFETMDDLREKIRFYLSHETERRKIIAAAQLRIKNEHLYVHRIRRILELI